MTREEYIEALLPEVRQSIVHFVGAENERRARAKLDGYTTNELSIMYAKQKAAEAPPAPIVTKADIDREKLRHQEELDEIRLRGQAERCADYELFKLQKRALEEPQRRAEQERRLKIARETFPVVCRAHNLSECEANFRLLFEADVLDSEYMATQGITSGAVTGLVAASPDEAEKFQQERIDHHNAALLSASPIELRKTVRAEAEQRRVQAAQNAAAEADLAHQARDAARQYSPLPHERNGKPLDAAYIKRADRTELRFLIQRFGESAVTARLRGQG